MVHSRSALPGSSANGATPPPNSGGNNQHGGNGNSSNSHDRDGDGRLSREPTVP